MAFPKFQTKEVLNKVLNTGEDALNVDLADSVSVTVDSEFPDAEAIADNFTNPTTTSVMSMLMGFDGTYWDRVTIGDGTAATALRVTISTNDSHFGAVGVAADADGVIHGQLRYIADSVDTVETSANAIQTAVEAIDDWDESDRAKVNLIAGQAGITANAGAAAANTPRVTLASDDPGVAKLGEIETTNNANQVLLGTIDSDTDDIKTAVELIDDTVAVLGTATYSETSTKGSVVGVVRNDTLATLADTDNEVAPLQVNAAGALYTSDASGEAGSIFVSGTNAITTTVISNTVFVAIQFITDSVFNSGNSGLISATNELYPSTQYTSTSIDADDGAVVDSVTFPQGMTIFGRWSGFQLASGKVIAYIGYV